MSLVLGNVIGSGIYLLPSSLGKYGGLGIVGWFISALGALALARVFASLSRKWTLDGGPYAYTRRGFGDFAGFWVAWGYWISIWCTNAAITVALVSYLGEFFAAVKTNPLIAIFTALGIVWTVTAINLKGLKLAGSFQLVTTILKIIPLLAVAFAGIWMINWSNFAPVIQGDETLLSGIMASTTLTLFAFLGIECATIPAREIQSGAQGISVATWAGTIIAAVVYILSTMAVMGLLSPDELTNSTAPFADAAEVIWGHSARSWVALGAIVSTLGALNGWIMMQGQIPLAAASDGLFPSAFGRLNRFAVPGVGLVISSVLISVLMLTNYTKGLAKAFEYMILLSTLAVLVPYLFSSAVFIREEWSGTGRPFAKSGLWVGFAAFTFSMFAVVGSGAQVVYLGFILLCLGIPVYVFLQKK